MSNLDSSLKPSGRAPRIAIYTCTFSDYDVLTTPYRPTPNCDYIAFVDKPQSLVRRWSFRSLPSKTEGRPQNEVNRFCKLFPMRVLPEYDVTIYVDGNIFIAADLTPLIDEFLASGADFALFPGQADRTVRQEIELTLQRDKVRPDRREGAIRQLADLNEKGEADLPITMNGVLFRKHESPHLEPLMQAWWDDINKYAMRDQYGLPGLLRASPVKVHHWDWQYFHAANPYFSVRPHRQEGMSLWDELMHAKRARKQYAVSNSIVRKLRRRVKKFVKHRVK